MQNEKIIKRGKNDLSLPMKRWLEKQNKMSNPQVMGANDILKIVKY
jgi:hypothetical protein